MRFFANKGRKMCVLGWWFVFFVYFCSRNDEVRSPKEFLTCVRSRGAARMPRKKITNNLYEKKDD